MVLGYDEAKHGETKQWGGSVSAGTEWFITSSHSVRAATRVSAAQLDQGAAMLATRLANHSTQRLAMVSARVARDGGTSHHGRGGRVENLHGGLHKLGHGRTAT